jgi:hypothetical protein
MYAGDLITARAPENPEGPGTILRMKSDGSETTILADTVGAVRALVVAGTNIFFSDRGGTREVSVDGGEVRQLDDAIAISFSVSGSTIYLSGESLLAIDTNTLATSVVIDEPALYPLACGDAVCWVAGSMLSSELVRLSTDGSRETLATGLHEVHALAFDGENFFLTMGAAGLELLRVPAQGGDATLVTAKRAFNLAFDDECLYWAGLDGIFAMSRAMARVTNAGAL